MGEKLVRSAFSTILREARDGSTALLDRDGNTVAQAELIPMQLGTIGSVFQSCAREYDLDALTKDDFFIINDPYSGGQHLQDIFFFSPIFHQGRRVGFAASVAHHLDIGGGAPGLSPNARDVHSEGIILPPTKFSYKRDWNGGILEKFLRANVRAPLQTMGDCDAQISANMVGARRVIDLCDKYGAGLVMEVMSEFQAYSERRFRAGIAVAPDGVYYGEDFIDDDGNCSNVPVESLETDYPFMRVEEYSLRRGSAGAGERRGGLGACRVYRILADGVTFNFYSDRFKVAPWGLFGGKDGQHSRFTVERNGERISLPSKGNTELLKGDRLIIETAGGGYGDPGKRDRAAIEREIADGLLTAREGAAIYGYS